MTTLQQGWEEEFDERFTYGVVYSASSDLSGGKGIDWRYPKMTPEEMKSFIRQTIKSSLEATVVEERDLTEDEFQNLGIFFNLDSEVVMANLVRKLARQQQLDKIKELGL